VLIIVLLLDSFAPNKFIHILRFADAIFYDVAYYINFASQQTTGVFFPGSRHKSWFDGHSFASGMFPFGNGKSQESSSEAVNGYYGAYLWSVVRNGASEAPSADISIQTDFARLLLATEIRGARLYWHMTPSTSSTNQTDKISVYSPQFAKNYMVGNLGMLDAICSTWFGTEKLYVHMINFLPVTSVTGNLFGSEYVSQEYPKLLQGEIEMAWLGYVVSNHAIIDPDSAWADAQSLFSQQLDTALSKSQVLYWISTREGFNASSITKKEMPQSDSSDGDSSRGKDSQIGSSCLASTSCAKTGLTGDCCPTSGGLFLDCCSKR
jgi:endoglucanase Acf2